MLASPPIDFHVTDTYFVVAHFHHVLFGTIVFSTFAGIYFWFPKMTGGLLDEPLSEPALPPDVIGLARRVPGAAPGAAGDEASPPASPPRLTLDVMPFAVRRRPSARWMLRYMGTCSSGWRSPEADRPSGESLGLRQLTGVGHQLPAAAAHNFTALPRIRSERPALELHHPHMVEQMRARPTSAATTEVHS